MLTGFEWNQRSHVIDVLNDSFWLSLLHLMATIKTYLDSLNHVWFINDSKKSQDLKRSGQISSSISLQIIWYLQIIKTLFLDIQTFFIIIFLASTHLQSFLKSPQFIFFVSFKTRT